MAARDSHYHTLANGESTSKDKRDERERDALLKAMNNLAGATMSTYASLGSPKPKPEPYTEGEPLKLTFEGKAYNIAGDGRYLRLPDGSLLSLHRGKVERMEDLKYGDIYKDADGKVLRRCWTGTGCHYWQVFGVPTGRPDNYARRPLKLLHRPGKS